MLPARFGPLLGPVNIVNLLVTDNLVDNLAANPKLPRPIFPRTGISKDCFRGKGRHFNQILEKVNENLDAFFGMRLEAVPEKTTPQFILVNALDIVEVPYFDKSSEDHLINGVLLPVLGVIFMLKGKTKEGEH